MNFSDGVQVIHHMDPVPEGTSNQDGSAGIDMAGYAASCSLRISGR